MRLPEVPYADGIGKGKQIRFTGLDHNPGAGDGALWDMKNLTSDCYPLLATRRKRRLCRSLTKPNGLFAWDALAWVDGTSFYYDGEVKGTVTDGEKRFAAIGAYIIILPDKKYYDVEGGTFGSLESSWSGEKLTFTNGRLYEEDAEANAIQCDGVSWADYFRAGDAVTISGCTKHPENNKTPVIREIDGDKMYFYENVFKLDGDEGTTAYSETGSLTVKRTVPELQFLCENENRLWGCDGRTIYASKLGDPFNWNVFEGLATDSYAVDTGSAGDFTGCVSFLGYPVFFKEDHIYKVYGSIPSNFEVMGSATLGVAKGCGGSLAIAGERLLYLSNSGVMLYSGGIPQSLHDAFGMTRLRNGRAGSDGLKYYLSAQDESGAWRLYVYDTRKGTWHIEDGTHATHFCRHGGNTYFLEDGGRIYLTGNIQDPPEGTTEEDDFAWYAETGDFTENDPDKKGLAKLQLRIELGEGAEAEVRMQFDSSGEWVSAGGRLAAGKKRSYYLPVVPRRADHYRIRIEGRGECRVYSLTREYANGSPMKSTQGRQ